MDKLKIRYRNGVGGNAMVEFGVFALAAYLGALRGNKLAMADLGKLKNYYGSLPSIRGSILMSHSYYKE